jgi:hypothetical protein
MMEVGERKRKFPNRVGRNGRPLSRGTGSEEIGSSKALGRHADPDSPTLMQAKA